MLLLACDSRKEGSTTQVGDIAPEFRAGPGELVFRSEKAAKGFVVHPGQGNEQISILNMQGAVVHSWPIDAMRVRLLENCNILVVHAGNWGNTQKEWRAMQQTIREYDWQGNVVWEYNAPSRVHHDITRTTSDTFLFPIKVNLDTNAFSHIERMQGLPELRSDNILEVNRNGDVLWEWVAHEQLDLQSCGKMECGELHNKVGWTHVNTTVLLPENKWFDAGDSRFRPGNVLTMLRNWWTAMIIDKDTKEVVWQYTGNYRGGLSGGHEPHMIPKGMPGAGNILMFDNGREIHKGESIVLEIDPITQKEVWVYEDGKRFFSHSAGSVTRLANGNTFVSQDAKGYRMFEVTPEKEIVWEFKSNFRIARGKKYAPNYCPALAALPLGE